jgi:hypothetical protein
MIGTTLGHLRHHLESLSAATGTYYVVCGRTGEQPVPAAGLSFESRPAARAAVRATEQYRAALRRYDPEVPVTDPIVCQRAGPEPAAETSSAEAIAPTTSDRSPIDFCHTVAGAVFETIADAPFDGLENAIMDTYLETAETIGSPDELCLRLLESTATELATHLELDEQAAVLTAAAVRLSGRRSTSDPIEGALSRLCSVSLLAGYDYRPRSEPRSGGCRSWELELGEYALGRDGETLVTLPIALELFRQDPARPIRLSDAVRAPSHSDSSWRVAVTTGTAECQRGLATLPAGERS